MTLTGPAPATPSTASATALPGGLHQPQRRDALFLDRPAIGLAHRGGVEQG